MGGCGSKRVATAASYVYLSVSVVISKVTRFNLKVVRDERLRLLAGRKFCFGFRLFELISTIQMSSNIGTEAVAEINAAEMLKTDNVDKTNAEISNIVVLSPNDRPSRTLSL